MKIASATDTGAIRGVHKNKKKKLGGLGNDTGVWGGNGIAKCIQHHYILEQSPKSILQPPASG